MNVVGAGLLDVSSAVSAPAAISPVSTSFGAVPAGSGQTRTATVTIRNLTGSTKTWAVGIADKVGCRRVVLGESSPA